MLQHEHENWHIATLTEQEKAELEQMENKLGFVLIAYENNQRKESKSKNDMS